MKLSALLTSAGINIAFCAILFSLYSVLRKQPSNVSVYFGRRLAQFYPKTSDPFSFHRLVPSPSWLVKAWETSEEEILADAGVDAVVFIRIIVFSIRIFSIAAVVCMFLVLPLNYYGQAMHHEDIPSESLDVFSIGNVKEGSKWLWVHCLALYIISSSACVLLYFEYKSITNMRLEHITKSPPNPSHFVVLVRSIPWSQEQSYSDLVKKFFLNYHASSYLSHQMVYVSPIHKLVSEAYKVFQTPLMNCSRHGVMLCKNCGVPSNSFKMISNDPEPIKDKVDLDDRTSEKVKNSHVNCEKFIEFRLLQLMPVWLEIMEEGASAFVFFKTRYAAAVASQVLQSSNPMSWVINLAPEPHDVYWSNLWIPYKQLWIRRIATLLAAIVFMFLFLIPVTFVQGLTQLDHLQEAFPFLRGVLQKPAISQVITGYLPSVILILFLYTVPPVMMLFSAVEGSISRSGKKKSACSKVLCFTIWNVFFVNVFSGSIISQVSLFSSVKDLPTQLARAVPTQAGFFMTYVLTSGWASMSFELVQVFALLCNCFTRFILQKDPSNETQSFPYHTEIPRVLLFGLLGFTCSILAPIILPILLVYFSLAYLVYRNQILNVYKPKYESGGEFWPIVHNTTIFSLLLAQIIAMGVFGLKKSPIVSGFTIPLVIGTLLFNVYCRQRFLPIFGHPAATILIELDRDDERNGRMEEIHGQLRAAYNRTKHTSKESSKVGHSKHNKEKESIQDSEGSRPGKESIQERKS